MTLLNPDLLESILGDRVDEKTRTLLGLLAANQEGHDESESEPETLLNTRTRERAERAASLRRRYNEMTTELDELRFRNDALARALGACPNCWGETPECRMCSGRGTPGTYPIDPELFAAVVDPALRTQMSEQQPMPDEKGDTDA